MESLRGYNKIRPRTAFKDTDHYTRVQNMNALPRELQIENMKRQMIGSLISRLSVPKQYDQKYKNSAHPEYQQLSHKSSIRGSSRDEQDSAASNISVIGTRKISHRRSRTASERSAVGGSRSWI